MPVRLLAVPLACLALVACGEGGWSLKEFTGKSLLFQATTDAPTFELMLDYDTSAKGCGVLGGARVTQDGKELKPADRGGVPANVPDAPCFRPRWLLSGAADALFTTLKLEDGSERVQTVVQNLFVPRTVVLKSAPSGRVGDWVELEYSPATDKLEQVEVGFIAEGQTAAEKVTWYSPAVGQAQLEKNLIRVAVPSRQLPAAGRLVVAADPKVSVFACDALAVCKVQGLISAGSVPFTVQP